MTRRMAVFSSKVDLNLAKFFKLVEQRYRTITRRMRSAFAREQSIYGGGQAAVARSQISVAINQGSQVDQGPEANVGEKATGQGEKDI